VVIINSSGHENEAEEETEEKQELGIVPVWNNCANERLGLQTAFEKAALPSPNLNQVFPYFNLATTRNARAMTRKKQRMQQVGRSQSKRISQFVLHTISFPPDTYRKFRIFGRACQGRVWRFL